MDDQSLVEMQILTSQLQQMQQYIENIEAKHEELKAAKSAIDELKTVKKGDEILVPVASGIFLKAIVDDPKNLLVNIGAQTIIEKTPSQSLNLLEEQDKEMDQMKSQVNEHFGELYKKYIDMQMKQGE